MYIYVYISYNNYKLYYYKIYNNIYKICIINQNLSFSFLLFSFLQPLATPVSQKCLNLVTQVKLAARWQTTNHGRKR